jgi:hypothetical protein
MSDGPEDPPFGEIIEDPRTEAFVFACLTDQNDVVVHSNHRKSAGEKELVALSASVLAQYASGSEQNQTEFIKSVVREFNDRKKTMSQWTNE